jgi:AcrR family transcriptional regulator
MSSEGSPLRDELDEPTALDGRRARRDRNRDAVVEAFLDLLREGNFSPSVGQVAERSEVSHRSVFRYFEDLEELFRVAIEKQHERTDELAELASPGKGPLTERVQRLVEQRVTLFAEVSPVLLAARARAPFQQVLAADQTRNRTLMRSQIRAHFRPEFSAMSKPLAEEVLASVDVLCSFETYDLLRNDRAFTRPRIEATLTTAILCLVTAAPPHENA